MRGLINFVSLTFAALAAIVAIMIFSAGCRSKSAAAEIASVHPFDAKKYMGKWYEIARLDHHFEHGLHDVFAVYLPDPENEGRIQVINHGIDESGKPRRIVGKAYLQAPGDRGDLKVSFWGPFYNAYRVIYINDDYSAAVVSGNSKKFLWILSRQRTLSKDEAEKIFDFVKKAGFDTENLIFPQRLTDNQK
jgi:apolipoprotein D and lipocalin family protein